MDQVPSIPIVPNSSPIPVVTPPPAPPPTQNESLSIPLLIMVILLLFAVAAGGVYLLNQRKQETPLIPQTNQQRSFFLDIRSPMGIVEAVDGEILVGGQTLPDTILAIYSDLDDVTIQSDKNGHFESSLLVGDGGGVVGVTAYSSTGEEKSATFEVAGAVLGAKTDAPGQVKKVEDKKTKPDATVTKKAEKTASQNTTDFLSNRPISPKAQKLGVVKLKEAITKGSTDSARLGKMETFKVKEATPGATLRRHAEMGIVTQAQPGKITIMHQIQTDRQSVILYNALTVFTSQGEDTTTAAAIQTGLRVVAVGIPSPEGLLATRIHIIPGKAFGVLDKIPQEATESAGGSSSVGTSSAVTLPTHSPTASSSPTVVPQ